MKTTSYPTFRLLLKDTFGIFSDNWKRLIGISIIPAFLNILALIGFSVLFLSNILSQLFIRNYNFILIGIPVAIFLFSALAIVGLWSQSALIYTVVNYKKEFGVKEAYSRSWEYVGRFFKLSTLIGLMIIGGLILLLAPGLLVLFYSSLAFLILFTEGKAGRDAVYQSRHYISANPTQYFNKAFIWFFLIVIISALIDSITGNRDPSTIQSLIRFIFNLAVAPLTIIYSFLNYQYLKSISPQKASRSAGFEKKLYLGLAVFGLIVIALALIAASYFAATTLQNSLGL